MRNAKNPDVKNELNKARSQDFRLFLQSELSRRVRETPTYSLRTFSKFLQTDASALVKLLKGNRPLGPRLISRLGKRLGLAPDEIQEFIQAQDHMRSRSASAEGVAPEYQQLTLDTFRLISDWYHYAILELIRVDHFKPDPKWISKVLNIPVNEINFAIERMIRLELLEIKDNGQWVDRSEIATNIVNPFFDSAQRKLQKQILEKAIYALENVGISKRDQSSMTMAIDTDRLPEAKERIKAFRRELARFLSRGDKRTQVYQLSLSLYPVSEINSDE